MSSGRRASRCGAVALGAGGGEGGGGVGRGGDGAPEHQAVLALRVVEELSYEAIAASLGVPVGTVMSRLSRARAELKTRLEERTGERP